MEAVICAATFRRGRESLQGFPPSMFELYDAVVARPEWHQASDLTGQGLVVARVLDDNPDLAARYEADIDAGLLGFGAGGNDEIDQATRNVEQAIGGETRGIPDGGGLLGGDEPSQPWQPGQPDLPPPDGAPAGEEPDPVPAGPPMAEPPMAEPPMAEPPMAGPPMAEPPTAEQLDIIRTWLNAGLAEPGPLAVAVPRRFEVYVGERSVTAQAVAAAFIPIARDEESIALTVQLLSSDFTVPATPETLNVGRDGRSGGRAAFDIVPLHDGPSTLTVAVTVKGNFLQRLDVTFDVGSDSAPQVDSFGRPMSAAQALGERVATMQFMPTAGGYQLIATQVSADPIEVRITPDELAARINGVRDELLATVQNEAVALNLDLTPADNAGALERLAFEGFRLFQSIFSSPQASPQLRDVGRWLVTESKRDDFSTLQVVSSGFPVPWALMYLTEDFAATPRSWDNFIGMRCVVEQVPMLGITTAPPEPRIESTPALSVRALYNDGIDATMASRPVTAQRSYWAARGVALTEGTSADDLIARALSADAGDKVLYLYCHAAASSKDPDDAKLILTGSQSVSLGQLQVFAPLGNALAGHPLVFINACESGELTPTFYDGFVPYFLAKGARGVIGTEAKTPGLFASEWAKAFFDDLFSGKALGQVVLDQRRRFLAEHNNPLGLLYGVHCDTDTVVDPALTTLTPTP